MAKEKHLIVIVGPTAIGKTSLSIKLAKHFNCPVLSADSRQFFKEIAIGTAKPSEEEMDGVPHYFIDSLSIQEDYNVGKFEEDALIILQEIFLSNDYAIMVGGSGLYVDAVCKGIDDIPKDDQTRKQLMYELEKNGISTLQEELKLLDPEHYDNMNIHNPHRLVRALEVCRSTGRTYTSFRKNQVKDRPFEIHKIGLNADRELVYENINQRVDLMMKNGLLEEVRSVYPFKDFNSLNTVGYKELFKYIDGTYSLEEAVELIKKNTRNFAKRQMTWFKRDKETMWFEPPTPLMEIINSIESS
ncbi:MAG: tRNA (adenosine(37)-N6)-dimethylallyltransferase MiaA [Flavobacteriales bacterium]|nr:tRNA (adenosine(37)-N6)-dimethylallyltransferase MiaA [Flavobacteriales bacterium]